MNYLENEIFELIKYDSSIFNFIQESSLDGFWYWDLENPEHEWMDRKFWATLGYDASKKSHLASEWQDIINQDDLSVAYENFTKHCENPAHPYDQQVRYTHKKGHTVWIRCKGMAIRDTSGKPIRMLGAHTDITKLKEAEIKTQKQAERYQYIIDGAGIGTWEMNLQTKELVLNESWANILGYTLSEIGPIDFDTWMKYSHKEDVEEANQAFTDHLAGNSAFYEHEVRMKHKDGNWRWIGVRGKVVSWIDDGKPEWAAGSTKDITDRKEQEIALEKYKDLLERTNEAASIGTWELNTLDYTVEWSTITRKIYEVDDDYIPGFDKTIDFYPEGVHRKNAETVIVKAIKEGENFDVEFQILTATNKPKWVRAIGISEFENGKCSRLYGLFQDIDERKKEIERNKFFIEQAPTAIAMFDTNMNYLATSQKWLKYYGLEGYEIINNSIYDVLPEFGNNSEWEKFHQDCLKGVVKKSDEECVTRKDGSVIWLTWEMRPWYLNESEIGGIIIYTADITRLKIAEKNNMERKVLLETILESMEVGILSCNAQGELTIINKSVRKWWPNTTFQERSLPKISKSLKLYKPDGVTPLSVEEKPLLNTLKGGVVKNQEVVIYSKDRTARHLIVNESQLIDENGQLSGAVLAAHDITDRKRAEDKLRVSEDTFRGSFENAAIGMANVGLDGNWMKVNDTLCHILGYSKKELLKMTFQNITYIKDLEIDLKLVGELIDGKKDFYHLEKRYVHKKGKIIWGMLSVSVIRNSNGTPCYFVVQITDISTQKKSQLNLEVLTEKLTKQNTQLASFAHIASHNLRAPVSNLNSLLHYYKELKNESEKNLVFEKFEVVINHLTSTLNTLVESIKIKTASTLSEKEQLSFDGVMNKTLEMLSGELIESSAQIKCDFSQSPRINYNKVYLESVFLNLVSNALRYASPDRVPEVTVKTIENKGKIIMKVKDNGLGIDLKRHGHKLFGLNKTFHRHKESKGVGLYITKTQVEAMGGTISATSQVNKGSVFTIII